ncbi:MAG: hypothetical protein U0163_01525, partial [Gemmatimonadaceae bacterium]
MQRTGDAAVWRRVYRLFWGGPPARRSLFAIALLAALGACGQQDRQSDEFATFVDRYLDEWSRRHPSIAAG